MSIPHGRLITVTCVDDVVMMMNALVVFSSDASIARSSSRTADVTAVNVGLATSGEMRRGGATLASSRAAVRAMRRRSLS